jgi:hypothetical protein
MELREALDHVAEIRDRLAAAEQFRGYRALPSALAGIAALGAGILQPIVVPEPMRAPTAFVVYWSAIAAFSLAVAVVGMGMLSRFDDARGARQMTRTGLTPLLPSLVAGAGVTLVLLRREPESAWMLPGLWQLLFSQGLFAACRTLPRPVLVVPCFYLATGLCTLCVARDEFALSPWSVAVPFGIGQLAAALALYWTLERHEQAEKT